MADRAPAPFLERRHLTGMSDDDEDDEQIRDRLLRDEQVIRDRLARDEDPPIETSVRVFAQLRALASAPEEKADVEARRELLQLEAADGNPHATEILDRLGLVDPWWLERGHQR